MTAKIINFSKIEPEKASAFLIDSFVGQKLKQQREKLDLSLQELAETSKIPSKKLELFEKGEKCVGVKNLMMLKEILGVDFSYFFKEVGK